VVPPLDLWATESQDKEKVPKIRLIRFLLNGAHMEDEGFHEADVSAKEQNGRASERPRLGCTPTAPKDGKQAPVIGVAWVVLGRAGVYAPGACSCKGCAQWFRLKLCICVRACVCARLPARVRACRRACVRLCSARELVCVEAAVWLWGPLVRDGPARKRWHHHHHHHHDARGRPRLYNNNNKNNNNKNNNNNNNNNGHATRRSCWEPLIGSSRYCIALRTTASSHDPL